MKTLYPQASTDPYRVSRVFIELELLENNAERIITTFTENDRNFLGIYFREINQNTSKYAVQYYIFIVYETKISNNVTRQRKHRYLFGGVRPKE